MVENVVDHLVEQSALVDVALAHAVAEGLVNGQAAAFGNEEFLRHGHVGVGGQREVVCALVHGGGCRLRLAERVACGMAQGFQLRLKSGTRFTELEIAGHEIEAMAHGLVKLLFAYFYHFREIAGLHVEQR